MAPRLQLARRVIPTRIVPWLLWSTACSEPRQAPSTDNFVAGCADDSHVEHCPCDANEPERCFTGAPAIAGKGWCRAGLRTCRQGAWSACEGEIGPQQERCNAFDDDCDGVADDGD